MTLTEKILKDIHPDNVSWISREITLKETAYTIRNSRNSFKYTIIYDSTGNLIINNEKDLVPAEDKLKILNGLFILDNAIVNKKTEEEQNRRQRLIDAILEA